ncbi:TonB-dependent receptor plug domain-containing protein [Pseudoalteromonas ulvae]|uniref:TonB-dependent receptor plug domain-containing protein n=1 Tax=Pseudoalteromonas ulvae TaxID=107327 RepID=UPI00186B771D|nr:TonB-dependent receptor [Pseudoalteromonas ulvae]
MLQSFRFVKYVIVIFFAHSVISPAKCNELDIDLFGDINIEEFLNVTVSSASGLNETLRNAPAAMVVVSEKEIKQRGYRSLEDVIMNLPSFDNSMTYGNGNITSYQRGYRTPYTQRTLIMINGIVDNHLWTQEASLTSTYPLNNIERIEVLYGPASAVYGANAFSGVINIITKQATKTLGNGHSQSVTISKGSYNSNRIEASLSGASEQWQYNISGSVFKSDEPDIDDFAPWGYLDNALLSNQAIWGPIVADQALANECANDRCPHQGYKNSYGQYHDASKNWGILADASYGNLTAGLILWQLTNGYGVYYPNDRGQPGSAWQRSSEQFYLKHHSQFTSDLKIKTLALYRENRQWGDWAEAYPVNPNLNNQQVLSSVSLSKWNSINDSWLLQQDYEWQFDQQLTLSAGIKYQHKSLTKAYEVCGYWEGSFCSTSTEPGVVLSTEQTIPQPTTPAKEMASNNLIHIKDKGLYLQGIWQLDTWRINAGARYDRNSIYGGTFNPRLSAIHFLTDSSTVKLIYGEAFQEPSAAQLWGGWNGRDANEQLQPEQVKNLEFIYMYQQANWLHDFSLFSARYDHVIKEEAENAGHRRNYGLEYRGQFKYQHPWLPNTSLSGHVYYTYIKALSSVSYDHQLAAWVGDGIEQCNQLTTENDGSCRDYNIDIGDIAPHKINANLNLPISEALNLNLAANWVSRKKLYVRNPLRAQHQENASYFTLDANMSYQFALWSINFKINNIFDKQHYHSGVEAASSGNDFSQRSQGWYNSQIPQVGRNFVLSASFTF